MFGRSLVISSLLRTQSRVDGMRVELRTEGKFNHLVYVYPLKHKMREIIDCQLKETVGHDISFDFFQFLLQKNRISQEPITCS